MKKFFGYLLLLISAIAILTSPFLFTYKKPKPEVNSFLTNTITVVSNTWSPTNHPVGDSPLVLRNPEQEMVMALHNTEVVVIYGTVIPKLNAAQFDQLKILYSNDVQIVPLLSFWREKSYGAGPPPRPTWPVSPPVESPSFVPAGPYYQSNAAAKATK